MRHPFNTPGVYLNKAIADHDYGICIADLVFLAALNGVAQTLDDGGKVSADQAAAKALHLAEAACDRLYAYGKKKDDDEPNPTAQNPNPSEHDKPIQQVSGSVPASARREVRVVARGGDNPAKPRDGDRERRTPFS